MKTYLPKVNEIERKWYVVDATDKPLGRLAVRVTNVLRGRHKPIYTPHLDTGDFVVVINAGKVKLTGDKENGKIYDFVSGYMSGRRERTARQVREKDASVLVERAVKGMMPRTRLGRAQLSKMKVYNGAEHPHVAQQPQVLEI